MHARDGVGLSHVVSVTEEGRRQRIVDVWMEIDGLIITGGTNGEILEPLRAEVILAFWQNPPDFVRAERYTAMALLLIESCNEN